MDIIKNGKKENEKELTKEEEKELYRNAYETYQQALDNKIINLRHKLEKDKEEGNFKEEINYCPICGGDKEVLTGCAMLDELFKKSRYEYYCNVCKEKFIIFMREDFGSDEK